MTRYFNEVANLPVLRPEEERSRARRILMLEVALWSRILSHPPLVPALLAPIEARIDKSMIGRLAALCKSARAFEARADESTRRHFELQRYRAAERIRQADPDREVLEAVYEQIRVHAQGGTLEAYLKRVADLYARSQRARNDFVKANLRLVVIIARRYYFGQLSFQDLIQEGNIGLIKAVGRYDPRRGYRFSTYASWWIRHAVTRALSDKGRLVRVPVHLLGNRYRVRQAQQELENRLGRPPTSEEICSCTGLEMDKVEQLQEFPQSNAISLESTIDDEGGQRHIDLLQDSAKPAPIETVMGSEMREKVEQVLGHLKPIEADVMRKRYGLADGLEHSLAEVGRSHHLSRERIRQIQNMALDKIRRELG